MLCKKAASTIVGTSMGQEICRIFGQVSNNFLSWKRHLQTDTCGLGERLTKRQLTHAKLKEKHKWSNEKPRLDNARRLRGIYFIDPEDKEFKETIENARKKLETPMAPAMPCKTSKKSKHGETCGKTNGLK